MSRRARTRRDKRAPVPDFDQPEERARSGASFLRQPLTDAMVQKIVITVCDSIYPQDNASYSEADSVFYGAFARAIERHHGIR
mgnify:CR=1 FL=1